MAGEMSFGQEKAKESSAEGVLSIGYNLDPSRSSNALQASNVSTGNNAQDVEEAPQSRINYRRQQSVAFGPAQALRGSGDRPTTPCELQWSQVHKDDEGREVGGGEAVFDFPRNSEFLLWGDSVGQAQAAQEKGEGRDAEDTATSRQKPSDRAQLNSSSLSSNKQTGENKKTTDNNSSESNASGSATYHNASYSIDNRGTQTADAVPFLDLEDHERSTEPHQNPMGDAGRPETPGSHIQPPPNTCESELDAKIDTAACSPTVLAPATRDSLGKEMPYKSSAQVGDARAALDSPYAVFAQVAPLHPRPSIRPDSMQPKRSSRTREAVRRSYSRPARLSSMPPRSLRWWPSQPRLLAEQVGPTFAVDAGSCYADDDTQLAMMGVSVQAQRSTSPYPGTCRVAGADVISIENYGSASSLERNYSSQASVSSARFAPSHVAKEEFTGFPTQLESYEQIDSSEQALYLFRLGEAQGRQVAASSQAESQTGVSPSATQPGKLHAIAEQSLLSTRQSTSPAACHQDELRSTCNQSFVATTHKSPLAANPHDFSDCAQLEHGYDAGLQLMQRTRAQSGSAYPPAHVDQGSHAAYSSQGTQMQSQQRTRSPDTSRYQASRTMCAFRPPRSPSSLPSQRAATRSDGVPPTPPMQSSTVPPHWAALHLGDRYQGPLAAVPPLQLQREHARAQSLAFCQQAALNDRTARPRTPATAPEPVPIPGLARFPESQSSLVGHVSPREGDTIGCEIAPPGEISVEISVAGEDPVIPPKQHPIGEPPVQEGCPTRVVASCSSRPTLEGPPSSSPAAYEYVDGSQAQIRAGRSADECPSPTQQQQAEHTRDTPTHPTSRSWPREAKKTTDCSSHSPYRARTLQFKSVDDEFSPWQVSMGLASTDSSHHPPGANLGLVQTQVSAGGVDYADTRAPSADTSSTVPYSRKYASGTTHVSEYAAEEANLCRGSVDEAQGIRKRSSSPQLGAVNADSSRADVLCRPQTAVPKAQHTKAQHTSSSPYQCDNGSLELDMYGRDYSVFYGAGYNQLTPEDKLVHTRVYTMLNSPPIHKPLPADPNQTMQRTSSATHLPRVSDDASRPPGSPSSRYASLQAPNSYGTNTQTISTPLPPMNQDRPATSPTSPTHLSQVYTRQGGFLRWKTTQLPAPPLGRPHQAPENWVKWTQGRHRPQSQGRDLRVAALGLSVQNSRPSSVPHDPALWRCDYADRSLSEYDGGSEIVGLEGESLFVDAQCVRRGHIWQDLRRFREAVEQGTERRLSVVDVKDLGFRHSGALSLGFRPVTSPGETAAAWEKASWEPKRRLDKAKLHSDQADGAVLQQGAGVGVIGKRYLSDIGRIKPIGTVQGSRTQKVGELQRTMSSHEAAKALRLLESRRKAFGVGGGSLMLRTSLVPREGRPAITLLPVQK